MSKRDKNNLCPKCQSASKRLITVPGKDHWKPITLEHISMDGPVHFETKQSLQTYCRDHGLASGALL